MSISSARRRKISKYLSYILRHNPGDIGVTPDQAGWVHVDTLLARSSKQGLTFSREELEEVVNRSSKQRFALSEDGAYIRANYGHSIDIDPGYTPKEPPEKLYHGTASRNLRSIREKGLHSGNRQYVHLSVTRDDAIAVGQRHGRPVVLTIHSLKMFEEGISFYQSESGIWLTKRVPPEYITFPE